MAQLNNKEGTILKIIFLIKWKSTKEILGEMIPRVSWFVETELENWKIYDYRCIKWHAMRKCKEVHKYHTRTSIGINYYSQSVFFLANYLSNVQKISERVNFRNINPTENFPPAKKHFDGKQVWNERKKSKFACKWLTRAITYVQYSCQSSNLTIE